MSSVSTHNVESRRLLQKQHCLSSEFVVVVVVVVCCHAQRHLVPPVRLLKPEDVVVVGSRGDQ